MPLRGLLTRDVLVSAANYAVLALVDISFRALQPIFLSTPIELGGLGLDPPVIGAIMSFFGILSGVFVVFFFSRMTDYFGAKGVYLMGITAAVPCFSLFPIINYLARNSVESGGVLGVEVWIAVGAQVVLSVVLCLSYGASVSTKLKLSRMADGALRRRCLFQALYLSLSPQPHRTRLLWELRTGSRSCRSLSCVRLVLRWRVRCIRCRSIRSIII